MSTSSQQGTISSFSRYENIPDGAVRISSQDVLLFQMERLANWKPQSEVWPLTKGAGICSAVAVVSSLLTNNHFRRHFRLQHFGRASGYLVVVCMPTVVTFIIHSTLVTRKVLIGEFPCPTCLMTKSALYQAATGALYPSVISPIFCLIQAKRYLTAAIDPANRLGDTVKVIARTAIPFKGFMLLSILSNMAIGMCVSQMEMDTFLNVLMKKEKTEHLE